MVHPGVSEGIELTAHATSLEKVNGCEPFPVETLNRIAQLPGETERLATFCVADAGGPVPDTLLSQT